MKEEKRGKFILQCRKEQGLSQEQLGEMLSYSRNNISKWERGVSFPSDPNVLEKMASIFNVSIEEIMYGEKRTKNNNQEITNNLVNEYKNKYKEAYKKSIAIIISIFTLIIISVLFVYFVFIRGSIRVYKLTINDSNFRIEDSVLLLSNSVSILDFNNVESVYNEEIEFIELYYYENGNKRLVFGGGNEPSFIEEDNGYSEYNLSELHKNDVYLYIKTTEKEYHDVKVDLTLKYINNNIFPKKEIKISEDNEAEEVKCNIDFLLENGFNTNDNKYFDRNINENIYMIIDSDLIKINFFKEKDKLNQILVSSIDSEEIILNKYDDGVLVDSKYYSLENQKDCYKEKCESVEDLVAYINYLKEFL